MGNSLEVNKVISYVFFKKTHKQIMIDKKLKESLKKIGISISDEAEVRAELLARLEKEGMTDIQNDSTVDLVEFATAFYNPDESEEDEDDLQQTQEEDLAPKNKPGKTQTPREIIKTTEQELDQLAEEAASAPKFADFNKKTAIQLRSWVVSKNLANKSKASMLTRDQCLNLIFPDKINTTTQAAKGKTSSNVKVAPIIPGKSVIFDGRNNPEHEALAMQMLEALGYNEETSEIKLLKQGFTVRLKLQNTKPTIMNFDELRVEEDVLRGNLYCNKLKSEVELMKYLPVKYHAKKIGMFRGETHPSIKDINSMDVAVIFSGKLRELAESRCSDEELAMTKNRAALEKQMAK